MIYSMEPISCLKHLGALHLCKTTAFAWVWNWSVSNRCLGWRIKIHHACLYTLKKERKPLRQRDMHIQSYILPPRPGDFPSRSVTYSYLIFSGALLKCDANLNSFFVLFTVDWTCTLCCLSLFISLSYVSLVLPHSCKTPVSIPNKRSPSPSLSSPVFLSCQ